MRTHLVELSLRRHFEEVLNIPEEHADRIELNWVGDDVSDNALGFIIPRITRFARAGPRDGDIEIVTVEVTVALKAEPGLKMFGILSLLVDEVRRAMDSTRRDEVGDPAAVAKIYDREGQAELILDFGPAQEVRRYATNLQVGAHSLTGVDLAVLTSQAQTSPFRPRVTPRT